MKIIRINGYKLEMAIINLKYKKSTVKKYDTKLLRLNKILAKLELINNLKAFHNNGISHYKINLVQIAISKLYKKLEIVYNTKKAQNIESKIKFLKILLLNCEMLQNNKNKLLNSSILVKSFI